MSGRDGSPAVPLRTRNVVAPIVAAEQSYAAREVARILGISRATFYTLAWFKSKKVRPSPGTVRYLASDVSLYQSLNRGL